jgi:hypothetical protein
MSDEDVVKKFVGDYEQQDEDKIKNDHPEKDPYYPRNGVKLRIDLVKLTDVPGRAYAKIKVTDPTGAFSAKPAIENAVFLVAGDALVATDMELKPGLLLTETLTMTSGVGQVPKVMLHSLKFSDEKHGTWICKS